MLKLLVPVLWDSLLWKRRVFNVWLLFSIFGHLVVGDASLGGLNRVFLLWHVLLFLQFFLQLSWVMAVATPSTLHWVRDCIRFAVLDHARNTFKSLFLGILYLISTQWIWSDIVEVLLKNDSPWIYKVVGR